MWTGEKQAQAAPAKAWAKPPTTKPPTRLTQEQKDDYFLLHGEEVREGEGELARFGGGGARTGYRTSHPPPARLQPQEQPTAQQPRDEVTLSRKELSALVEDAVAKALEKERRKEKRSQKHRAAAASASSLVAPAPSPPLSSGLSNSPFWSLDALTLLTFNIDDQTAELLAHLCATLLATDGCLDAWQTPVLMKKGRAAVEVRVCV